MKDSALIVFVRKPELGKVKTRLAASIGEQKALLVYKELIKHTKEVTQDFNGDLYLFCAGSLLFDLHWNYEEIRLQEGIDLGQKMKNAFEYCFSKGYQKVLVIGSDCPQISYQLLNQASLRLNETDAVIGPANDGGYYLLGFKDHISPEVFVNMKWSVNSVFEETVKRLQEQQRSISVLDELIDIDVIEDLEACAWTHLLR